MTEQAIPDDDYYDFGEPSPVIVQQAYTAAKVRSTIVAHLEELGGEYDLQFSASIRKLAENVAADLTGRVARGDH